MKQGLYTIFDKVAGINAVLQLPSDEVAKRYFKTAFKKNENFAANAADYIGIKLGTIDTETGEIEPTYEELIDCYDYLKMEGAQDETGKVN